MRVSDAAAFSERGKANARAAAAAAAKWAEDSDAWLRALATSDDVLVLSRRAVLATRLLRDIVNPDVGEVTVLRASGDD